MAQDRPSTLWIAHRGESHDAPENTLASVNLAWERRVPAVEIDVRLTGDGQPVVIHNATTGHMAGSDWRVSRRSLADLKTLDFGTRKGASWAGERIAHFGEILETVPIGGRLFVEIKTGPEVIRPIHDAIERSTIKAGQVTLIAFRRSVLREAVRAMPCCDAAWIVDLKSRRSKDPDAEAARLAGVVGVDGLDAIDVGLDARSDLSIVPALQARGLRVFCWTVNDPDLADRLIQAGIDGIASDRAAWLMGKVRKRK